MSKPLFNTFKNRLGQNVPMCATIENSEEVLEKIKLRTKTVLDKMY